LFRLTFLDEDLKKTTYGMFLIGFFFYFTFFMYVIQHCFICRPSDSTVLEEDGIEPSSVLLRLWHCHPDALLTRLDLIPISARSNPHSAKSRPHSARSHPHSSRSHPHSARSRLDCSVRITGAKTMILIMDMTLHVKYTEII
jgi:hypothetical protein